MNEFDNFNGFLMEKGEKLFNTSNRSFKYGDAVFETMKVVENEVLFWDDHFERLQQGLSTLKINQDQFTKEKWASEVQKVIYKNYYKFAKLRLTVCRDSPGLYTPMTNKLNFIIEGVRYDSKDYSYLKEGLSLGVYEEVDKPINITSNCKTTSALVYVMASIYKKEQGLGDVVVLNSKGKVCETSNANLFLVKDDQLYTPGLDQGCVAGVFRKQVIEYCKANGIAIKETPIEIEDLNEADEIFLTNVIAGVQGVSSFQGKEKEEVFVKSLRNFFG